MSQQINLYSPLFRKQRKVFSAVTMLQSVALIVVAVVAFYYVLSRQVSVLEVRANEAGQQLKVELERLKVYGGGDSPAERLKALGERRKALEENLATQKKALDAIDSGALGRTEGYAGLLHALARLSMDGVWLTRIQVAEGTGELSIAGRASRAELVPLYLERLRSEEALRGQNFARLELVRQGAEPPKPGAAPGVSFVEFVLTAREGEPK